MLVTGGAGCIGSHTVKEVDVIVDTAWRWRESHPNGYGRARA